MFRETARPAGLDRVVAQRGFNFEIDDRLKINFVEYEKSKYYNIILYQNTPLYRCILISRLL